MIKAKEFPVYQFIVRYKEKDKERRVVFIETMCGHELSDEECRAKINDFMVPFLEMYPKAKGKITLLELKIDRMAEWRLVHFSHETFQKFKNEEEAFKSFRNFVYRSVKECHDAGKDTACLMRADEEARWTVCCCDDCQKDGRTVINH